MVSFLSGFAIGLVVGVLVGFAVGVMIEEGGRGLNFFDFQHNSACARSIPIVVIVLNWSHYRAAGGEHAHHEGGGKQ